jgi:hypothetical protein
MQQQFNFDEQTLGKLAELYQKITHSFSQLDLKTDEGQDASDQVFSDIITAADMMCYSDLLLFLAFVYKTVDINENLKQKQVIAWLCPANLNCVIRCLLSGAVGHKQSKELSNEISN